MKRKGVRRILIAALIILSFSVIVGFRKNRDESGTVTIVNVSYDPTRELFEKYNELFQAHYASEHGEDIQIIQSHGGSGSQVRSVIEGADADVVTLACEYDVSLLEKVDLLDSEWKDRLPGDSAPYTSTIVFLVRKGNEKNIKDWDDLVQKGVDVITPDPKSSGGACWNFLAAWAYAREQFDNDEEQIKKFMKKLYQNVLVLDSGARGATSTFVEKGQGDVLIAWENEAYLSMEEYPDDYEIVTPSISILAQPSVAVVDSVAKKRGTEEVAREYLNYLYSDDAQRLAGENYYRPSNEKILKEFSDQFNLDMNLVTIDDFGGWDQAFKDYFDDGAVFDQIYSE